MATVKFTHTSAQVVDDAIQFTGSYEVTYTQTEKTLNVGFKICIVVQSDVSEMGSFSTTLPSHQEELQTVYPSGQGTSQENFDFSVPKSKFLSGENPNLKIGWQISATPEICGDKSLIPGSIQIV